MTFLERYLAGDCSAVWHELGVQVTSTEATDIILDAQKVAAETMRRVRDNVITIVRELSSIGYKFGQHSRGGKREGFVAPLTEPSKEVAAKCENVAELIGPVPLSLQAFWSEIGSVDLRGSCPRWPAFTDALMVCSIDDLLSDIEEWRLEVSEGAVDDTSQLCFNLSPDVFQKDEASGGTYSMMLPDPKMDGVIALQDVEMPFVEYLRQTLRWGGFPGFRTLSSEYAEFARKVGTQLLPF
jgi:hypothetical protein